MWSVRSYACAPRDMRDACCSSVYSSLPSCEKIKVNIFFMNAPMLHLAASKKYSSRRQNLKLSLVTCEGSNADTNLSKIAYVALIFESSRTTTTRVRVPGAIRTVSLTCKCSYYSEPSSNAGNRAICARVGWRLFEDLSLVEERLPVSSHILLVCRCQPISAQKFLLPWTRLLARSPCSLQSMDLCSPAS